MTEKIDEQVKIETDKAVLSAISRETTMEEVRELDVIAKLKEASKSKEAWAGCYGLAAIQVGIPIRFAWFQWGLEDFYLLNPKITEFKGKMKRLEEGCLSIPNKWFNKSRATKIKYISDGKEFSAKGLKAQIIQHEIDHMNGILISD